MAPKIIETDKAGFFKNDAYTDGSSKRPDYWVKDCPDGMYKAQYQGGTLNAATGELTGGKWVDTSGPAPDNKLAALRAKFVSDRDLKMANLTVTIDGQVFDADEKSQARMHRAQAVMNDIEVVTWVLANNTTTLVTKKTLMKALDAASRAQAALWVMPKDFSL